jgi:hypothetical protein
MWKSVVTTGLAGAGLYAECETPLPGDELVGRPAVQTTEGQSIVLRVDPSRLPWDGVWSFRIVARWEDRCRLLVRSRSRLRLPGEVVGSELSGPVVSLMTRGMLLGIKRRAEAAQLAE